MAIDIAAYVDEVRKVYGSGQATEHSYRPALERLFKTIDDDVTVINEPKRLVDVGAPDFVFARKGVSVGWVEAKDIGKDVRKFATGDYSKEQKLRYTKGLPNLIYTNGLDFEFIRKGKSIAFITIADLIPTLPARDNEFPALEHMLREFAAQTPVSIGTAKQLAEMMAGKAVIIKDIMGKALVQDMESGHRTELTDQYEGFKQALIHDISVAEFADIYAETIAYGLFAARLHDENLDTFSRTEALELLPKTNPFLRSLFVYIAGPNLDDRLVWIIDELCDVFRATDLHEILKDFGKFTGRNDPFLHFYETFLAEYNPAKRKSRGVWYTPEPVVNFIVRAVDDVLKSEFGLADGLADTSKITIDWDTGQNHPKSGKPIMDKKEVHRVQILDPATGTGTFLAEVIKQVAGRVKGIAPGQWSNYVEKDLIPRIHGFELLMASYAMCHMKIDMVLTELGYKPSPNPPRLGVYLTNSLEEGERVEQTLPFARWISEEAKGANTIKRDTPIMVVIGNPPYSGESVNKGPWIMDLMEAYKKEPGGKEKLKERNPKWINDDYVKFIRFAEHMIEKNGEGVLGFITNHGYLDNPTFRGMRWHLLKTFDKIYVLDLHGNAKKKEVSPDGSPDKNVFDIMQGVAIIIGVKRKGAGKDKPLAELWHGDLWGKRAAKNDALWGGSLDPMQFEKLHTESPRFSYIVQNYALERRYRNGFGLEQLIPVNSIGIVTGADAKLVTSAKNPGIDSVAIGDQFDAKRLLPFAYRPFEQSKIYYDPKMIERNRYDVMRNYLGHGSNLGFLTTKAHRDAAYAHSFVTIQMSEAIFLSGTTGSNAMNFPLYLYPDDMVEQKDAFDEGIRVNFDPKIYADIRERAGLNLSSPGRGGGVQKLRDGGGSPSDTVNTDGPLHHRSSPDGPPPRPGEDFPGDFRALTGEARPNEVKVFDYIYGVLHSPDYRETYREFLKIDFPRIPYPASPDVFAHVSEKGEKLRRLHLMEDAAIGDTPFPFKGDGSGEVEKPRWVATRLEAPSTGSGQTGSTEMGDGQMGRGEMGRVYINGAGESGQYFDGVSDTAWNFHIGGYQPAQKWLKDRKGRTLDWDDIRHYQKIIKILGETDRIMREIVLPLESGG